MQQMMIYWQSIIPQHVSGVFTESQVASCVLCAEDVASQATSSAQTSPPDSPEAQQP